MNEIILALRPPELVTNFAFNGIIKLSVWSRMTYVALVGWFCWRLLKLTELSLSISQTWQSFCHRNFVPGVSFLFFSGTLQRTHFFFISHRLSVVGLRPSSALSTGCVVPLRGDRAIFCHAGSGRIGRVWPVKEQPLKILRRGWELNPGHGEDRQWAIPLSYHDWPHY